MSRETGSYGVLTPAIGKRPPLGKASGAFRRALSIRTE